GESGWEVCLVTDAHSPFEPGKRPVQIPLAEAQQTEPPIGIHKIKGVRNCLGNPQPFISEDTALSECAQLGMTHSESGPGGYRWRNNVPEALVAPLPIEESHGLPEAVDGPTIVTPGLVDLPETVVRLRLQDAIATGRGEREGALASGDGLVIGTAGSES